MCSDRAKRYQSASELVDDIDRFLNDRESVSPEDTDHVPGEEDSEELAKRKQYRRFLRKNAGRFGGANKT